jgi:hypothetical protein
METSPLDQVWEQLDIPVDDDAEPDDAVVEHLVPQEEVE